MSELRKDPVTGRWVIISSERSRRPSDYSHQQPPVISGGFCPLCPGNEGMTPPEVLSYRSNGSHHNTPGWSLRVVPNKFPALRVEGSLERQGEGIYDRMSGIGAHEVIVECPDHNLTMATMPTKMVADILMSYAERIRDLKKDNRFRYVSVFKNYGQQAGASLDHPHSQLIALPVVPKAVAEELHGAYQYYEFKERCVFCDIVYQETSQGLRIVSENENYLAVSAFAARFPFEIWILPKKHDFSFEDERNGEYKSLAAIFSEVFQRMDKGLGSPPFNYILHTGPFTEKHSYYYHWHFEIIPALAKMAGFEWGSGFYINTTSPEDAAGFLREI